MMKNSLALNDNSVKVVKPTITFTEYETLIKQSQQVADYIDSITLTEENAKDVKKVLANANKAVKALNDRRISIKKEIMEPYEVFNGQIKEIEKIVKDADERLRDEVRALDEKQREEKEEVIKELWTKRTLQYEYAKLMDFDDFLENKHLNKSYSLNKVEDDMVAFLEKSENDLKILSTRDDDSESISLYKENKDLGLTLTILEKKKKEEKEYKKKLEKIEVKEEKDPAFAFIVTGVKDKKFVEMLLKSNQIEFEIKEIQCHI